MIIMMMMMMMTSLQPPRSTRSSSVITLARPSTRCTLKITDRSFRHASPRLWNQLPDFSSASTSSISYRFTTFSWSRQLTSFGITTLLLSPLHSFILASKPFFSINPTLHRPLVVPSGLIYGLHDCSSAFFAQRFYFCFSFFRYQFSKSFSFSVIF